jgi:leucyl aminopeptidase
MKLVAGRAKTKPDGLILFFIQGEKNLSGLALEVDRLTGGGVRKLLGLGFKGKRGETELLVVKSGRWNLVALTGLGEEKKVDYEAYREAMAAGVRRLSRYSVKTVEAQVLAAGNCVSDEEGVAEAMGESCFFACYRYREFKTNDKQSLEEVYFLAEPDKIASGLKRAEVVGEEHCLARDLVNKPGWTLGPEEFAKAAQAGAKKSGLKVKVYDHKQLAKLGYNGILMVGRGSARPPKLVEIVYKGAGANSPFIGLVGKGVTFDAGGISIKGSEGMEKMKYDMAGAAAVLGTIRAAGRLKLKVNLVAVLPLVENMPDGCAQRPGDVVKMADGSFVEVMSTDAEGRMILADGLYHCSKFKPAQMIDIATLTGAAKIVLGRYAIPLLGNDEALLARVSQAGAQSGERCWTLPLWDEYKELLRSEVADLKNSSWTREAGTIVGGIFLKRFVNDSPWAHLDIAGTGWSDESHPYLGRGPTGKGMRLLVRYLREVRF